MVFRVYVNADLVGVELCAAAKNVIALAAGGVDGLGLGDNAKAALITRGLAEMARLGEACGARPETFSGLAGMGDLIVTCWSRHGPQPPRRRADRAGRDARGGGGADRHVRGADDRARAARRSRTALGHRAADHRGRLPGARRAGPGRASCRPDGPPADRGVDHAPPFAVLSPSPRSSSRPAAVRPKTQQRPRIDSGRRERRPGRRRSRSSRSTATRRLATSGSSSTQLRRSSRAATSLLAQLEAAAHRARRRLRRGRASPRSARARPRGPERRQRLDEGRRLTKPDDPRSSRRWSQAEREGPSTTARSTARSTAGTSLADSQAAIDASTPRARRRRAARRTTPTSRKRWTSFRRGARKVYVDGRRLTRARAAGVDRRAPRRLAARQARSTSPPRRAPRTTACASRARPRAAAGGGDYDLVADERRPGDAFASARLHGQGSTDQLERAASSNPRPRQAARPSSSRRSASTLERVLALFEGEVARLRAAGQSAIPELTLGARRRRTDERGARRR